MRYFLVGVAYPSIRNIGAGIIPCLCDRFPTQAEIKKKCYDQLVKQRDIYAETSSIANLKITSICEVKEKEIYHFNSEK